MGYLSDWDEAEQHAREVQERFPDCTGRKDCPTADDAHTLDCGKKRRLLHPEFYAQVDEAEGAGS